MFKLKSVVAALLLTACGPITPPEFENPPFICPSSGFEKIELETERNCECIIKNVVFDATTFLEENKLIKPGTDFSDLTIRFYDAKTLDEPLGDTNESSELYGRYYESAKIITVERFGAALAHELMHYYEIKYLGVDAKDSVAHKNWDKNGYTELTERFWNGHAFKEGRPVDSSKFCP